MLDNTRDQWKARAAALSFRGQAFIGGRFTDAASGRTFDSVNPATGEVLTKVAECDAKDVDRAVTAARRAFEAGHWSRAAPAERKRVLLRLADLIRANLEEMALLDSLDIGQARHRCRDDRRARLGAFLPVVCRGDRQDL